jgi:hypothetical protein
MKRTYRKFRLVTLLAPLALAACNQPVPMVLTPPPALLTCKPAPEVPAELPPQGTIERERATVELWLAEREAGADCRNNLAGVKKWSETVAH